MGPKDCTLTLYLFMEENDALNVLHSKQRVLVTTGLEMCRSLASWFREELSPLSPIHLLMYPQLMCEDSPLLGGHEFVYSIYNLQSRNLISP